MPTGADLCAVGGLEHQERLEFSAGVVPYRQHGLLVIRRSLVVRLRSRTRRRAEGEQQGKRDLQDAGGHGGV